MSHNVHKQAYTDIISKLHQGYAKQLWQTNPKGGAKNIAHPVLPAQHTTEADLLACIRAVAVTPVQPAPGSHCTFGVKVPFQLCLACMTP